MFGRVIHLVDSSTVLCYLHNEDQKLKPFEGVRVAEIQAAGKFEEGLLPGLKFSLEKLISWPDPISSFSYPAPTKFFVIQIYCPNLLIININCPYGTLKSIQSDGGGQTRTSKVKDVTCTNFLP